MWNRCVVEWLRDLRQFTESYDDVQCGSEMNVWVGDDGLWECVRFARVCRIADEVGERVERLRTQPVVYETLYEDDGADVAMWKRELRHSYCGEEEDFMESEDLLADCVDGAKATDASFNKPGTFPVDEEEEVTIREPRHSRVERPKTLGSTLTKLKEDRVEIRGVTHVDIGKDKRYDLKPYETLHLVDDHMHVLDATKTSKSTIGRNLQLKKTMKVISNKELEISDSDRNVYRLHFEYAKDAKTFLEIAKARLPASPSKNAAPWWQLRKLLKKRSSRDLLESKGIIKNEPIFGNTLEELCDAEHPVPEVITRIIRMIEEPTNIRSVGLYRASANLAVLQNIRFEINFGRWEVLEKYSKDVDVLAGTLKLFFRELKRPLISYEVYQKLQRGDDVKSVVEALPRPNKATLLYIVKHLLKVCEHKEHNKMDFHNLSICWGPSLITLPDNCVDLVTQTTEFTRVTEHLLDYYQHQTIDDYVPKATDFVYEAVRKLTAIIDEHLDVEGIYRKSGSSTKIDKIMKLLDKRNVSELDAFGGDVHELCCVLKKFLSNLIPHEFFVHYFQFCDTHNDQVLVFQVRTKMNEFARKDVLVLLMAHLGRVLKHEKRNKMSFAVLSDIWMTTLLGHTSIQHYKKQKAQLAKLFKIFMDLGDKNLPDLVAESECLPMVRESQYDNVPDDIHDNETCKMTKL